jgi:protein arginine N-methyltransferase 1
VAQRVAEHNLITNVEFLEVNSRDFAPAEKLDHIVQEQIGWFDLFIEPVQLKDDYRIPFIWEQRVQNIDYSCMEEPSTADDRSGYYLRVLGGDEVSHLLCEPEVVYACDLETMKEADLPDRFGSRRVVGHEGRLDGCCLYFDIRLLPRQGEGHRLRATP